MTQPTQPVMTAANMVEILKSVPVGTLLHLEYEPIDGVRPEVAMAAKVLGADPRTYIVEVVGSSASGKGDPLLHGRCLNRGFEKRSFNMLRGKVTKLEILRFGARA